MVYDAKKKKKKTNKTSKKSNGLQLNWLTFSKTAQTNTQMQCCYRLFVILCGKDHWMHENRGNKRKI